MDWKLYSLPLRSIPFHYVPFRSTPLYSINQGSLREEIGQTLKGRTKLVIKLNLQKEVALVITKERRKDLIKRRYNSLIVRSLVTMIINVGLVMGSK